MKRVVCALLILCILPVCVFAAFDESMIPPEISEEALWLHSKTEKSEHTLTGIRFDLDDENMPVIIVKEKQKNISERSIRFESDLWIFSYDPYSSGGSLLTSAGNHYQKDYLGIRFEKRKNGKIRKVRDDKDELKPGEEYEWEMVYQIANFSDPVYMYFITEENSHDLKWQYETIVVVPENSSVRWLKERR